MHVLIVSNTYPPDISGVGSLVQELARQLHESAENSVKVLTRTTLSPDPWVVGVGGSKALYPFRVGKKFVELCERESFDLIHIHESDAVSIASRWWRARQKGEPLGSAKLVATLQVTYDQERRMIRPLRADGEIVSLPTIAERWIFREVKAPIQASFGRRIVKWADAVVAPSRVTKQELIDDYGADEDTRVIYNGLDIDASNIPRADPGKRRGDGTVQVLYMGRLRTRKAAAVLLRAFVDVLRQHPHARLRIVGDGEQRPNLVRQSEALKKRYPELPWEEAVELPGALGRKDALRAYAEADIYCLPSLYEGFPVATLEAMAAGLPVVSTTVSGIPEQVEHGVTGLLVPPEDAGALSDALCRLIEDPELRQRMGEAGRKRVEEEFTIRRIADDYLELWHNLLDERG